MFISETQIEFIFYNKNDRLDSKVLTLDEGPNELNMAAATQQPIGEEVDNEENETWDSGESSDRVANDEETTKSSGLGPTMTTVPKLANDEQIFEHLCKKIAKYCQLLSKLTNCDAFFKAELALESVDLETASHGKQRRGAEAHSTTTSSRGLEASRTRPMPRCKKMRPYVNMRSLYWGTNRLLHDYTHEPGIRFERSNGDALIYVERDLLANVENIQAIIDEIVTEPNSSFSTNTKHKHQPAIGI